MSIPKIGVFNMTLPAEGPVAVPQSVDHQIATETVLDLTQAINDKIVSFITGAWIDNSANAQAITILCSGTNQSLVFPASKQGWVPLMLTNPPVLTISQAAPGNIVQFIFVNYPVFPYII